VYDEFLGKLASRAKALRVGNGLEPGVEMGPAVSEKQRENTARYVEIGKKEGAKLVSGGEKLTDGNLGKGWFFQPTIFADANATMRVACEEIFGPVTTVVPISSLEEGIRVANSVAYGLSGSIYTQDVNKAFTAMRDFETGIFYVNSSTIGAEVHLPFGGIKDTGNGHREAGIAGLDVFTEWKSIYVDFSGRLQKAQIDTHGE
jgi:aldehyde dehydrogenase (NAD+)